MLAVRLESSGPAIFRQRRYGRGGRAFTILKLRTMRNHDEPNAVVFWAGEVIGHPSTEPVKSRHDPRHTRLGRLLRRSSLDELPQLINVLRGEMSLVGPRPIPLIERECYGKAFATYCRATPGLTGLWQVSGRNTLPYRRRVALDLHYVRCRSVGRDLRILARTVGAVVTCRGAY